MVLLALPAANQFEEQQGGKPHEGHQHESDWTGSYATTRMTKNQMALLKEIPQGDISRGIL
jgi:hypothetical protein